MKRFVRSAVLAAAVLLPVIAFAEPKSADDWYKEGETQYNLGNFDKAADAFKQGYTLESVDAKKPAYLYNVAQAYRQGQKCKDAAFFYKRYVSLKDQDTVKPLAPEKRAEIQGWIGELEECEKNQESIAHKTPDTTMPPTGGTGTKPTTNPTTTTTTRPATGSSSTAPKVADGGDNGDGTGSDTVDDGGDVHKTVAFGQPKMLDLRLTGGIGKTSAGDLTVPIEPTFNLFVGYPIAINEQVMLDIGVNAGYTPVPYTNSATNEKKTGSLIGALVDVGLTYAVAPKIGIRVDVGAGVLVLSGIADQGNPFTEMGASTSGALGMFNVRASASLDYAFTPNVYGTLTPIAFSYSPAKTGLDFKSLTALDFMLGVGYRM